MNVWTVISLVSFPRCLTCQQRTVCWAVSPWMHPSSSESANYVSRGMSGRHRSPLCVSVCVLNQDVPRGPELLDACLQSFWDVKRRKTPYLTWKNRIRKQICQKKKKPSEKVSVNTSYPPPSWHFQRNKKRLTPVAEKVIWSISFSQCLDPVRSSVLNFVTFLEKWQGWTFVKELTCWTFASESECTEHSRHVDRCLVWSTDGAFYPLSSFCFCLFYFNTGKKKGSGSDLFWGGLLLFSGVCW